MAYRNPFRAIQNLIAERIDMGVDYGGSGPIYAIGPGVITEADTSWAGSPGAGRGTFIAERLSSGPYKGQYVYTAENINPRVQVGQKVNTGTVIGDMTGGIETGWAVGPSAPGETKAAQAGQIPTSGDPGMWSTAYGKSMSNLLASLGAPPGVQDTAIHGSAPGADTGTPCRGGYGPGLKFSYAQLEGLWVNAGGAASLASVMAAIALAESGGCSTAKNAVSGACGIWQINPPQAGCQNPATNASQAVAKWKGQGLTAWVTYSSGAYKKFLQQGVKPDTNVGSVSATVTGGGLPAPAASSAGPDCMIAIGTPNLNPVPSWVPVFGHSTAGSVCFLTKSEARALLAGSLLLIGGGILAVGTLILVAYGLHASGAGEKAGKAAGRVMEGTGAVLTVAGMPEAGVPVAAAGAKVRSHGATKTAKTAIQQRGQAQIAAS